MDLEADSTPSYLQDVNVSIPTTEPGANVAEPAGAEQVDEFGLPLVPANQVGV